MPDISQDPEAVRWRNAAIREAAAIVRAYFGDNARFCAEDILRLATPEPSGGPKPPPPRPLALG